jgi:hypothetical protein
MDSKDAVYRRLKWMVPLFLLLVTGLVVMGCEDNTVEGDREPPTVQVTSPAANAEVTGEVTISVSASDNEAVTRVDFYVDGDVLESKSQAPWIHSWDSGEAPEGETVIYARAYDAEENEGASDPIVVTVKHEDSSDDNDDGDNGGGDDDGDDGSGNSGTNVVIQNDLATPVNVYVNGSIIGSVPARETRQEDVGTLDRLNVSWSIVKVETDGGNPLGEDMGGTFETITNPPSTSRFQIDHIVGDQWYFFPLITNQTGTGLLMAVNWELAAETRCNCVVAPNSDDVAIGYYRLYRNTRVVGFQERSNYTGRYIYWEYGTQFTSNSIQSGTGIIRLTANRAPATARMPQPGVVARTIRAPSVLPNGWVGNDRPVDIPRRNAARPLSPFE